MLFLIKQDSYNENLDKNCNEDLEKENGVEKEMEMNMMISPWKVKLMVTNNGLHTTYAQTPT